MNNLLKCAALSLLLAGCGDGMGHPSAASLGCGATEPGGDLVMFDGHCLWQLSRELDLATCVFCESEVKLAEPVDTSACPGPQHP